MQAFSKLTGALWRFSGGRRHYVTLYVAFVIVGNTFSLLEPYVVGKLLNGVQQTTDGQDGLLQIWRYLGLLVLLAVGFWCFHGPARILERKNAFYIRRAFKQHLFTIVTSLPVQWHKANHSGQTINRISKASQALFTYSQNGFQLIEMLIRPVGAMAALCLIMPGAALVACAIALVSGGVILLLIECFSLSMMSSTNESIVWPRWCTITSPISERSLRCGSNRWHTLNSGSA